VSTIQQDVSEVTAASGEYDAAAELIKRWNPPKDASEEKPSEGAEDDNDEDDVKAPDADDDESDPPVQDDDAADDAEDDESDAKTIDDDEFKVKVKFDGEEREFALKDLKRLAGQEASLTKKSQEVAQKRKQIDDAAEIQVKAYEDLLGRAQSAYAPYANIDWHHLARTMDGEELVVVQTEARRRWDELQYLETGVAGISKQIAERKQADRVAAAQEALKILTDPETGIEGWNDALYGEIRTFAKNEGLDADYVDGLVDAHAFKLLHKAMLYDRGKSAVKVIKDKKSDKAPKRVIKSTKPMTQNSNRSDKAGDAMAKLKKSGSVDDAASALLARWNSSAE
jgi:hypothetical protein